MHISCLSAKDTRLTFESDKQTVKKPMFLVNEKQISTPLSFPEEHFGVEFLTYSFIYIYNILVLFLSF